MRRPAVVLAILASLMIASVPAEAGAPLPQTRQAARDLVHHTLDDADATAAQALREAQALVAAVKQGLPSMLLDNGEVEIRTGFTQPVVRDEVDFLALVWAGSEDARPWLGAFWIETSDGVTSPNLYQIENDGMLLFLDAGARALPESVDITYHFLGVDGGHLVHHVGVSHVLDFRPDVGRVELGAASASARGAQPEALLLTPWNLLGHDATVGFSVMAGADTIEEFVVPACADYVTPTMEDGCRHLYLLYFPAELTSVLLWHEDEWGSRVPDLEVTRAELLAGYQFTP